MTAVLGYARVITLGQDLNAQRVALAAEGVADPQLSFADKLSADLGERRIVVRAWRKH